MTMIGCVCVITACVSGLLLFGCAGKVEGKEERERGRVCVSH